MENDTNETAMKVSEVSGKDKSTSFKKNKSIKSTTAIGNRDQLPIFLGNRHRNGPPYSNRPRGRHNMVNKRRKQVRRPNALDMRTDNSQVLYTERLSRNYPQFSGRKRNSQDMRNISRLRSLRYRNYRNRKTRVSDNHMPRGIPIGLMPYERRRNLQRGKSRVISSIPIQTFSSVADRMSRRSDNAGGKPVFIGGRRTPLPLRNDTVNMRGNRNGRRFGLFGANLKKSRSGHKLRTHWESHFHENTQQAPEQSLTIPFVDSTQDIIYPMILENTTITIPITPISTLSNLANLVEAAIPNSTSNPPTMEIITLAMNSTNGIVTATLSPVSALQDNTSLTKLTNNSRSVKLAGKTHSKTTVPKVTPIDKTHTETNVSKENNIDKTHTEKQVSKVTPIDKTHIETPASKVTPVDKTHIETPLSKVTPIDKTHIEMPLSKVTRIDKTHIEMPASKVTPVDKTHIETPLSKVTPIDKTHIEMPLSKVTPIDNTHIETPLSKVTHIDKTHIETPLSKVTPIDKTHIETTVSKVTPIDKTHTETTVSKIIPVVITRSPSLTNIKYTTKSATQNPAKSSDNFIKYTTTTSAPTRRTTLFNPPTTIHKESQSLTNTYPDTNELSDLKNSSNPFNMTTYVRNFVKFSLGHLDWDKPSTEKMPVEKSVTIKSVTPQIQTSVDHGKMTFKKQKQDNGALNVNVDKSSIGKSKRIIIIRRGQNNNAHTARSNSRSPKTALNMGYMNSLSNLFPNFGLNIGTSSPNLGSNLGTGSLSRNMGSLQTGLGMNFGSSSLNRGSSAGNLGINLGNPALNMGSLSTNVGLNTGNSGVHSNLGSFTNLLSSLNPADGFGTLGSRTSPLNPALSNLNALSALSTSMGSLGSGNSFSGFQNSNNLGVANPNVMIGERESEHPNFGNMLNAANSNTNSLTNNLLSRLSNTGSTRPGGSIGSMLSSMQRAMGMNSLRSALNSNRNGVSARNGVVKSNTGTTRGRMMIGERETEQRARAAAATVRASSSNSALSNLGGLTSALSTNTALLNQLTSSLGNLNGMSSPLNSNVGFQNNNLAMTLNGGLLSAGASPGFGNSGRPPNVGEREIEGSQRRAMAAAAARRNGQRVPVMHDYKRR